MTEKISLYASIRGETEKANTLRLGGFLPAIIYGHEEKNQNLKLNYNQFVKAYKVAGTSSLVNLIIDKGEPVNVLIQEVQKDVITDMPIHADFYKVKMTEKITADINLVFAGEAPAVKELGATLVKNYDHLEVECLPGDLVHEITVDLSTLKNIHDAIHVSDLNLPKGIVSLVDADEVIATALTTKIEEEKPAEAEAVVLPEAETAEGATAGEPEDDKKDNKKEKKKE